MSELLFKYVYLKQHISQQFKYAHSSFLTHFIKTGYANITYNSMCVLRRSQSETEKYQFEITQTCAHDKITPCRDEDGHRSLSVDILKPDAIFGTFSVGQSYQGQRGLVQGIQSKVLRGRIIVP